MRQRGTRTRPSKISDPTPHQGLGGAPYYLGYHINPNQKARTVTFDQRRYSRTVVDRFDVRKTTVVPSSPGMAPLYDDDGPQSDAGILEIQNTPYRQATRALMWIAAKTRRDSSFAAYNLVGNRDNPGLAHRKASINVLQCHKRTAGLGVLSRGRSDE